MKFYYAALIAVLAFTAASAQSPSQVLKRAERALGGTNALKAVNSVHRSGMVVRTTDGTTGRWESFSAKPNLYNISIVIDGFETEKGFNGRSAWSRDSRDGLRTLTGSGTLAVQARAAFLANLWLSAKADKSKLVSGGQTVLDGRNVSVVVLTTSKNIAIRMFFDPITGLLVRDEMEGVDGPEITDYSDYRKAGGVMMAYAFRISAGAEKYDVKLDEIEINPKIASSEFDFPAISGKPLPDLPALLAELRANEDRVDDILESYAFTQKQIRRELGKDGVLRELGSETYQLSFYKGNRISRLVEKNGKPLNAADQADADKDASKRVAEIEKQLTKDSSRTGTESSNGAPSQRSQRISVAEVLRASTLLNPRRERFRGRDVIVFDFEPNPAFDFKNAKSMIKFFGKTAGVMWIDEKDKQVARIEAVLAENFNVGGGVLAKLRKGASFTLEQERINDEIWLPSQTDINLSVRVLLVKGIDVNQLIKSYDYRRFDTQVKDASVNEVKKP
ncbi:MAG: hypothetical protein ABJA02_01230 [Acidobacteriota bacterium]